MELVINMHDERIVVKMTKAVLVLYPSEVADTVKKCPDLFIKAIKRGKGYVRGLKEENRTGRSK